MRQHHDSIIVCALVLTSCVYVQLACTVSFQLTTCAYFKMAWKRGTLLTLRTVRLCANCVTSFCLAGGLVCVLVCMRYVYVRHRKVVDAQ
jgi:hypothetical protein